MRCLICTVTFSLATFLEAEMLSRPDKQVDFSDELHRLPRPKWGNGYLVTADLESSTVYGFDRTGRLIKRIKVAIPDSDRTVITDATIGLDGTLAAAGTATSRDGAAAAFITWITSSGSIERVVRTSPFVANRLCFATDGSLWAAGRVVAPGSSGAAPPHDVLRQYNRGGRSLRSALPRDSLGEPGGRHPAADAHLVASKDRIGMYSVPAREWIELSSDGAILGRWKGIDPGRDSKIMGVALTTSGTVYVSARRQGLDMRPTYFKLDRNMGGWLSLDATNVHQPEFSGLIFGADNNHLVVLGRRPTLLWIPVP